MKKINKKISLSSAFPARTRCAYCKSGPAHLFLRCMATGYHNHFTAASDSIFYAKRKSSYRNPSLYLKFSIFYRKHIGVSFLSKSIKSQGFNTNDFRNIKTFKQDYIYTDFFACKCFRTQWATNDTLSKDRKDISCKKSKNNFPPEIIVYL